ncbi:hypothetical protein F1737_04805 [Methanoplanus sp. FWC-SCC4]|uniref:Hsp20/alpha crystallin family protein n=1 Tax=Methanochimaera problematica TaxID=2609417 RepID=A0AA97FDJ4_9EURY|nr:Hsp20/alpha crystallin family protein [Methanoplanus sp. FWC-SCC4]WOF16073.1 hypothetical protein F1737_04805 [Methanoplanus sp. FWC-SCC4]
MSEDNKDGINDISEIIRKMLEQATKKGNFPQDGKFSITITGGRLPLDLNNYDFDDDEDDTKSSCNSQNVRVNTPHTEVHKDGDNVQIYADIPGADIYNTAISVQENHLQITSFSNDVKHEAKIEVPDIKKETMKYHFRNGVLEINVKTADENQIISN